MSAIDDLISASIGTTGADFIVSAQMVRTHVATRRVSRGPNKRLFFADAAHLLISIAFSHTFSSVIDAFIS